MNNLESSIFPKISKFGSVSTVLFLIFNFIGRFLFPFGDEPDFIVRAPRVVDGDHLWWSPYKIFEGLILDLNVNSNCKINAGPFSILANIDAMTCSEGLEQSFSRFLVVVIVASPLLIAVVFRKQFVAVMSVLRFKLNHEEWNIRLDALSLTLIFPSVIFYLGVLAEEQLTLVLSLFIFLFWGSWALVFGTIALIGSIDLGNSIVVLTFVGFLFVFLKQASFFNLKIIITIMVVFVSFAYFVGFAFLPYIENIAILARKAEAMYNKAASGYFVEKYPVLLRPAITFMTGTFMTPSGIKVIPIYLIFGGFFLSMVCKLRKCYIELCRNGCFENPNLQSIKKRIVSLGSSITTILFFVFLLPDYGNAKYYVFIIPYIFYAALIVYRKTSILKIVSFCTVLVFLNLATFML